MKRLDLKAIEQAMLAQMGVEPLGPCMEARDYRRADGYVSLDLWDQTPDIARPSLRMDLTALALRRLARWRPAITSELDALPKTRSLFLWKR